MQTSQKERKPEEIEMLEKRIQNADLPIASELGETTISQFKIFYILDVGDVIELNKSIEAAAYD